MRLEIHDHLQKAKNLAATRLVVYDDFDNPVSISIQLDKNQIHTSHLGDNEFPLMLEMLGINRTMIVESHKLERKT